MQHGLGQMRPKKNMQMKFFERAHFKFSYDEERGQGL